MTEISTDVSIKKRKPPLNIIIPAGIAGMVILVMIITMITVTSGKGIRNGIYIAGVNVSKMEKTQATEKINQVVAGFLQNNIISVEYEGKKENINFSEFLSGYKVDEAVDKAYSLGRNKNFFSNAFVSLSLQLHKRDVQLEPILDESFITEFMDDYALKLEKPLKENTYKLADDSIKFKNGEKGYAIDKAKAIEDIKNILVSGSNGTVVINKVEQEPTPFDVDKIYDEICTPAIDAKYETKNGKGFLVKATNGYHFDRDQLRTLLEENKNNTKAYYMELDIIEPKIKTVNTDDLFNEVLGEYTSKITDSNSSRLNNVRLAVQRINGSIINPDEVFYYLKHVEPITEAGGYKIANVYVNGKIEQDIGGGVCQVSSALYSAVLYSNMEVVKRYNHSLTVGYVPLGQDATVSSGEIDFRFKNTTNAPVKISAAVDSRGVYIKLLGEKPDKALSVEIENVKVQTNQPQVISTNDPGLPAGKVVTDTKGKTGYVVDTYKNFYRNGTFIERVFVSKSVYKTLDTVQRVGTGPSEVNSDVPEPSRPSSTADSAVPIVIPSSAPVPSPEPTPMEDDAGNGA